MTIIEMMQDDDLRPKANDLLLIDGKPYLVDADPREKTSELLIPLWDKVNEGFRSHHFSYLFDLFDAAGNWKKDELLVKNLGPHTKLQIAKLVLEGHNK
jgi:hypothetical protein